MSRFDSGWEYVDGGFRWAPTAATALANILDGKYGSDYDEARRELDVLVRAVQRDDAEKIRTMQSEVAEGFVLRPEWLAGFNEARNDAVKLIFPDYPPEDDSE